MNKKPLVINLFGAPGAGKSTTASGLFFRLKNHGINCELTGEYAKILTWSKRQHALQDQLYVFGKQHHRVWTLAHDCDVIISDSPLLMALCYAHDYPKCFEDTIRWAFDQYNNLNFLVNRVKPYNPKGRNQTEEESTEKHAEILKLLWNYDIPYNAINGDSEGLDFIIERTLLKLKSVEKTC